jgi:hypothetical protein
MSTTTIVAMVVGVLIVIHFVVNAIIILAEAWYEMPDDRDCGDDAADYSWLALLFAGWIIMLWAEKNGRLA